MKSAIIPCLSGFALACMIVLGGSHWWQVRQQVAAWHAENSTPAKASDAAADQPGQDESKPAGPEADNARALAAAESPARPPFETPARPPFETPARPPLKPGAERPGEREFFETLVKKLKTLEDENKELYNQLGETNRSMMEMEFTLRSHAASFRPLQITNPPANAMDDGEPASGVLPPRAIAPDLPELPE